MSALAYSSKQTCSLFSSVWFPSHLGITRSLAGTLARHAPLRMDLTEAALYLTNAGVVTLWAPSSLLFLVLLSLLLGPLLGGAV